MDKTTNLLRCFFTVQVCRVREHQQGLGSIIELLPYWHTCDVPCPERSPYVGFHIEQHHFRPVLFHAALYLRT